MIFSKNGATVSLPLESQGARVGALGSGRIDRLPELPVEGLRVASWHSDGSIQLLRVGDSRKVVVCVFLRDAHNAADAPWEPGTGEVPG